MTSPRTASLLSCTTMVLFGMILLLTGCDATSAAFRATRTAQVAHATGTPVKVATDNGYVEIARGQTSDVEITAHLRARTQERLDATQIAVVREASGLLSISVDWPEGQRKSNEGCSFEIKVPDAVGVSVETSNGHIKLADLAGLADLGTSNGGIDVIRHDGEVRAHTSNGHVEVQDTTGKVKARTSNGAITLGHIAGEASANTSNGHVQISLAPNSPGPVFADSSNGSVKLELGPSFDGVVTMRTSNGRITVDGAEATGGKGDKKAKIGAGGPESIITTSNGSIRVLVKR